jgi:hypothetical protein
MPCLCLRPPCQTSPEKDAKYPNVTPGKNDGKTVYRLAVKDVPVDGFWSITLYNAEGYLQKNPYNAYSLNNITAARTVTGRFRFNSADAMEKSPTVCRSCLVGITPWASTAPVPKSSAGSGNSRPLSRFPESRFSSE